MLGIFGGAGSYSTFLLSARNSDIDVWIVVGNLHLLIFGANPSEIKQGSVCHFPVQGRNGVVQGQQFDDLGNP